MSVSTFRPRRFHVPDEMKSLVPMVVGSMIGHVPLPEVMRRLLREPAYSGGQLGDLRPLLTGLWTPAEPMLRYLLGKLGSASSLPSVLMVNRKITALSEYIFVGCRAACASSPFCN